jgi:hypothetical protein
VFLIEFKRSFEACLARAFAIFTFCHFTLQEIHTMQIAIPAERLAGEKRVAATPETVKKLVAMGHAVVVEQGAGPRHWVRPTSC